MEEDQRLLLQNAGCILIIIIFSLWEGFHKIGTNFTQRLVCAIEIYGYLHTFSLQMMAVYSYISSKSTQIPN